MQIRKATKEDLESIRELNRKLFEQDNGFDDTLDMTWPDLDTSTEIYTANIKDDKYLAQVAEEDGAVVGYMICRKMTTPSYMRKDLYMAELDHTYILPEHRGGGIGTEMFGNFEKWAKGMGCNLLSVTASAKNTLAKDFYEKVGFELSDVTFQKKI